MLRNNEDGLSRTRTRDGVVLEGLVDVDLDTGVGTLVRAGEADERRRAAAAAVVDLDLGAGDVELGCTSDVEADVLNAKEVLANVGQRDGVQDGE